VNSGYKKSDMEVLAGIWDNSHEGSMICPQCHKNLIIVQVEPVNDYDDAYLPYDTIIECISCNFQVRAESFTILGSVKDFDSHNVEIGSWSPSGSRSLNRYEHMLDFNLLKELKDSGELVEFLIVNNIVIQVVG
jgi:hypothetical protein